MYMYTCYNVIFLASEVWFSRTYERVREAFGLIRNILLRTDLCRVEAQVKYFRFFILFVSLGCCAVQRANSAPKRLSVSVKQWYFSRPRCGEQ